MAYSFKTSVQETLGFCFVPLLFVAAFFGATIGYTESNIVFDTPLALEPTSQKITPSAGTFSLGDIIPSLPAIPTHSQPASDVVVNLEDNAAQSHDPLANAANQATSVVNNLYSTTYDLTVGNPNDVSNKELELVESGLMGASNAVEQSGLSDRPITSMVDIVIPALILLFIVSALFSFVRRK